MKNVVLVAIGKQRRNHHFFPLALYYLKAALLEDKKIAEKINIGIEEFMVEDSDEHILKRILESRPEIIGFSCYVWNIEKILTLSSKIKSENNNVKIVLGGPETSPIASLILRQNHAVDIIVRDEGEITFRELVKIHVLTSGNFAGLKGITFRHGSKIIENVRMPIIKDLSTIPSPFLKGIVDMEKHNLFIGIEPCRGCYFRCRYCFFSKKYDGVRYFPSKRIESEIKYILDFEPRTFYMMDPSFGVNMSISNKICDTIIKYNRKTAFFGELRTELMTKKIVAKMEKANFKDIEVGLQSTNKKALIKMGRNLNMEKFMKGFRLFDNTGIRIAIDLIVGLPGDDLEHFKKSIDFVKSLGPKYTYAYRLMVLPGTYFYENADKMGLKFQEKAPHYVTATRTFSESDITKAMVLGIKAMENNKLP
ncbi:MAG: radical SAM protein [Candidatus Aenigmatarchaeota archaeon]